MTMLVFGLLLKIAMTASIVVAASVVVERSGPFIGSLIAALPTAGGAAMIILALEHSPEFISRSAGRQPDRKCSLRAVRAQLCGVGPEAHAATQPRRRLSGLACRSVPVAAVRLERNRGGHIERSDLPDCDCRGAALSYCRYGQTRRTDRHRSCLARRSRDVLCHRRHRCEQFDRFLLLGRVCVFSGGDGFFLHYSASAHRRAGIGECRRARAHCR